MATVNDIIQARRPGTDIDARVGVLVELAQEQLSSTAFGAVYNHAVALLVCHWLELDAKQSAAGPVTSKKEGQLAISYAAPRDLSDLSGSAFGHELQGMIRRIPSFAVRGMDEMPKSTYADF